MGGRYRHWCPDGCGHCTYYEGIALQKINNGKGYKCSNCGKFFTREEVYEK